MTHFKFGTDFITETQALDLCRVDPVAVKGQNGKSGWGWRGFTAKNAQKVAKGDRKLDPRNPVAYRSGARQLKKPDGSTFLVTEVSKEYATQIAKNLVKEEVRKARYQGEEDAAPTYLKVRHMTIVEAWGEWRESEKVTNPFENKKTTKAYSTTLGYLQNYSPKLIELRDIGNGFWDDWRRNNDSVVMSDGKKHSVSYKNKNEARFGGFIKWLQSRQYLNPNLALGQYRARKENPREEDENVCPFANDQELDRFFQFILENPVPFAKRKTSREAWILQFTVLAYSGIRAGDEFHQLVWEDVDFDKREITIRAASAKGGHGRTVGILPQVMSALKTMRANQSQESFPSPSTKVVPNSYGALWRVYNTWMNLAFDEGTKGLNPHKLRSFAINNMVNVENINLGTVVAWTGATLATIQKHYIKRDQKNLAQEKLDQIYRDYEGKQGGDDQKEVG